jgi:hypothetical protein
MMPILVEEAVKPVLSSWYEPGTGLRPGIDRFAGD